MCGPMDDAIQNVLPNLSMEPSACIGREFATKLLGTSTNCAPLDGSDNVPSLNGYEPDAFIVADGVCHGYTDVEQGSSEPLEQSLAPYEPSLDYGTWSMSPVSSHIQETLPSSFPADFTAHDFDFGQFVEYLPVPDVSEGALLSSLAQLDGGPMCEWSKSPESTSVQIGNYMDGELLLGSPRPEPLVNEFGMIQDSEPLALQNMCVPVQNSIDPQGGIGNDTSYCETMMDLDKVTSRLQEQRRTSWSLSLASLGSLGSLESLGSLGSLGSLRQRLSCTSSQLNEVATGLKRFSWSSKATKCSSATVASLDLSLDRLDKLSWKEIKEIPSDIAHTMRYPVEYPRGFLEFGPDALTILSWCHRCVTVLQDPFCTTCSYYIQDDPFIQDRGFTCLQVPRRDRFNNTILHVAAAMGVDYETLKGLIDRYGDLNAVNTAGQTFLHVIDPRNLLRCADGLPALLSYASQKGFDFKRQDHQGVNVLQALLYCGLPHFAMNKIFEALKKHLPPMNSRDNLGRTWQSWLLVLAHKAEECYPERAKALSELVYEFSNESFFNHPGYTAFPELSPAVSSEEDKRTEDLLYQSFTRPLIEDIAGRNGLHCLAEAHLKPNSMIPRYKQSLTIRRQLRQSHFIRLLEAGVHVNTYDKAGNTPLLAFLQSDQTRAEGNNDDGEFEFYLKGLVKAGADVNRRNRSGESALHVAVKLGIISATRVLIKLGANLHVRQKDGKGVIRVGLEAAQRLQESTKLYKSLHVRIMTCVNLVRSNGAVEDLDLTVFLEWDAVQNRNEKYLQTIRRAIRLPDHGVDFPVQDFHTSPHPEELSRWFAR